MKKNLLLALCLFPAVLFADGLTFLSHGKPVKTLSREEVLKLSPAEEIAVWEPHETKEVRYKAIPARALFDKVYGEDWKKAEEVLFTCSDGFQPSVSARRFVDRKGFFAIERVGQEKFTVIKTQENNVVAELGPFYLVWDNAKAPELRVEDLLNWPYQVTTVDLVTTAERFPHMAPPAKATAAAKHGFQVFRDHCFACHSVNGDGGNKAFDLNSPVNVTEYWKEPWLKRWIKEPAKIRPATQMPSLPLEGKDGEKAVSDIIAYLKVMASNKRKLEAK